MSREACQAVESGLYKDPEAFLARNLIYIPMEAEKIPTAGALRNFDVDETDFEPRDAKDKATGGRVFHIDGSTSGDLVAYYLPWAEDTGYHIMLDGGSAVRIALTAMQDGCAVGIVRGGGGAVRFSHHNISDSSGGGTSDAAQRESLSFATSAVHKSDYRVMTSLPNGTVIDGRAVTLGVRQTPTGPWRFFAQCFQLHKLSGTWSKVVITRVVELD